MIEATPAIPGRVALPRAGLHVANRPRVLVVDDEPHALAIFSSFLSAAGIEAIGASSGERALQLLAAETFDTVLTDVKMPGLDGISLLRAARECDADLRVILVTGCPAKGASAEALGLGAIDYLVKPASGDLLIRTVSISTRLCRLARIARSRGPPTGPGRSADPARRPPSAGRWPPSTSPGNPSSARGTGRRGATRRSSARSNHLFRTPRPSSGRRSGKMASRIWGGGSGAWRAPKWRLSAASPS